ncbi:MAG TPA: AAA family ATPase [Spirochaeta sp.]|nr:AAA family ATPase [Spirochaeta sp.]
MAEQLILKNLEFIKVLPGWAQELSYKYCSETANLYLIHGNIRDFLPNKMYEGEFVFVRIQEFISEVLFGNKDIIVFYDRSSGINFCDREMQNDYLNMMTKTFPDISEKELMSAKPSDAFRNLEQYFMMNISKKQRIVLIIDFAETIIPNANISELSDEDRYCLVTLNRWAHDPIFTQGDISIMLLSENLSDVNSRLVRSPNTVKLSIPLPDHNVRKAFLEFTARRDYLLLESRLNAERVASITSGLNLMNLNQIAAESFQEDRTITLDFLRDKKKEIIENEAASLLEFIETEHDLSMVAGNDFIKSRLKNAAKAIKKGQLEVLPMGYLIAGPVGTGKTFLVTAFAGEVGIPIVKFKAGWAGASDANFDKVMNIIKAMSPVGVLIDEADTLLGHGSKNNRSSGGSLFARIADFMGNTAYRGKIIWFIVTNRPDLIPIDLKRQGRAEEHLALFFPQSDSEIDELFTILLQKLKLKTSGFSASRILRKYKLTLSGADLEAILIRSRFNAALDNRVIISNDDIESTAREFLPPTYPHEIDLQNLAAVLECTSRDMIPEQFRNIEKNQIVDEIKQLKILLGEVGK